VIAVDATVVVDAPGADAIVVVGRVVEVVVVVAPAGSIVVVGGGGSGAVTVNVSGTYDSSGTRSGVQVATIA
jgi:hypothetical protein